jgi:sulfonate transport system substrate-binding protein
MTRPPRSSARPVIAVAIAAVTVVLGACSSSSSKAAPVASETAASPPAAATAAVPSSVPPGTTLRVADQLQALEEELAAAGQNTAFPYTVKYSNFVGGPPMLQAFQAGAVDIGFVADSPLIFAQAAHQHVVGVAAWAPQNSTTALVAAPGRTITGWADLKGKKVAYQQGTLLEAVVLQGLHSVGLSVKDITTVNLPATQIAAALQSGTVDAGILVEPLATAYLAQHPTAKVVDRPNDITDRVEFIIASTSALADPAKSAAIADYVQRLERSLLWINTHQAQWAQAFYVAQYHVPLAVGEKLIASAGPTAFIDLPGPLPGPQQTLADLYTAAGEIPSKVDVAAEFDSRFNAAVDQARS